MAAAAQTRAGSGSASAPGANAVVAEITALDPGQYKVRVVFSITGALETQRTNARLQTDKAGVKTTVGTLITPAQNETNYFEFEEVDISTDGMELEVAAVAAATASTVYAVTILATQQN